VRQSRGFEALKVELFGKKGAIHPQLKSLGAWRRRTQGRRRPHQRGPRRDRCRLRGAQVELESSNSNASSPRDASTSRSRSRPAARRPAPVSRTRRRIETIFRNAGFSVEEGRSRRRLAQLRGAQHPREPSAARCTTRSTSRNGRLAAPRTTSPVQVRAMLRDQAAAAHDHAGARLPLRFRQDHTRVHQSRPGPSTTA